MVLETRPVWQRRLATGWPDQRPVYMGDARRVGLGHEEGGSRPAARELLRARPARAADRHAQGSHCEVNCALPFFAHRLSLSAQIDWYTEFYLPYFMQWSEMVQGIDDVLLKLDARQ